jgi:hypothetical protein
VSDLRRDFASVYEGAGDRDSAARGRAQAYRLLREWVRTVEEDTK